MSISDPKTKWVIARLAEAYSTSVDDATTLVDRGGYANTVISFFNANGPKKLVFFLAQNELSMTTEDGVVFPGRILFFLRPSTRNVTPATAENDFLWSTMQEDLLPTLQILLSDVYLPLLESQASWGKMGGGSSGGAVGAFLGSMRKYVGTLKEASLILADRVDLKIPSDALLARIPTDAAALQRAVSETPELVAQAEGALAEVSNQVELFIAEAACVRVEDDRAGPESEVVFWRARMASFNGVYQQVTGIPWLKGCLVLLQSTHSPVVQRWVRIKQRLLEGTNEAKDNLKYLYTIEEILAPLYYADPTKMAEALPHLVATVRVVYTMARYYATPEHMTTLLTKVSNQMIRACRDYILRPADADRAAPLSDDEWEEQLKAVKDASGSGAAGAAGAGAGAGAGASAAPAAAAAAGAAGASAAPGDGPSSPLYDRAPADILARIDACIRLNQRYQDEYAAAKRALAAEPGAKQFSFSENAIFGNFNLFCARLRKVADVVITTENFSSLQASTLGNLQPILEQSARLIAALRRKAYDPLNHRAPQFEADYADYRAGICELEGSISAYVDAKFGDAANTVNDLVGIMRQLHVVLNRPALKPLILAKYDLLLARFADEVLAVRAYYEERRASPDAPRGWTDVAGRIAWARLLIRRIAVPYEFFRRVQIKMDDEAEANLQRTSSFENLREAAQPVEGYLPLLTFSKAGRRAHKLYMRMVSALYDYEHAYYEGWVASLASLRQSLQATVLVQHPVTGRLYVNFDRNIVRLCREVHFLRQLRVDIPEAALAICSHEKTLLGHKDALGDLLREIEELRAGINPAVADLMRPLLAKLNRKVLPGLKTLCWTSMNIGGYLDSIATQARVIRETVKSVDDILALRIATNLRTIAGTCLLPLTKRYPFGSAGDPSAGGTVPPAGQARSSPADDTDENAAYTSHQLRVYSHYLEQTTGALPYKQFKDRLKPHARMAAEFIYTRSQLVATAAIDVVVAITSRYVSSPDSPNAEALSDIVMRALNASFAAPGAPGMDASVGLSPLRVSGSPGAALASPMAVPAAAGTPASASASVSGVGAPSGALPEAADDAAGGAGERDEFEDTRANTLGASRDACTVVTAAIRAFIEHFAENTVTAVFLATERTLRAVFQRLTSLDPHAAPTRSRLHSFYAPDSLLLADFELAAPSAQVSPSWAELGRVFDEVAAAVLVVSKRMPKWSAGPAFMGTVLAAIRPVVSKTDPEFVATHLASTLAHARPPADGAALAESKRSARAAFEQSKAADAKYNEPASARASARRDGAGPGSGYGSSRGSAHAHAHASASARASARLVSARIDGQSVFDLAERLALCDSFYDSLGASRVLLKLLVGLRGAFATLARRVDGMLAAFDAFQPLWLADRDAAFRKFLETKPDLDAFARQIVHYEGTLRSIALIPTYIEQGCIVFSTEALKSSLATEAAAWKGQYAQSLNGRARLELMTLTNFINEQSSALQKKVADLDDVRQIMLALGRLRELEAVFDLKVGPIEDMYATLQRHGVRVNADEVEAVDQLRYKLRLLQQSAIQVSDGLKEVSPGFKKELVESVAVFVGDVQAFRRDWDTRGPNVDGIAPRTAVARLREFQASFNEFERKWITYSSGEETFGLETTQYPELASMKKDLKLLNALYGLYTDVLSTVDGYADQLWVDLNFDDIQAQMADYQQRCLRLPKAMKDWAAFLELRQRIEDFGTLLPLFQAMSHPAIKPRHWTSIADVTHTEGVRRIIDDPDNFRLKELLAAPLLPSAEDIEDICNAAVKETDIEEKLAGIRAQWQEQAFTFAEYKSRGLVTLRPADTSELIVMLEDSQMLLSSLVSNRYNKPFKDEIVAWVKRLSTLDEILSLWLSVQQAWIYLEAVFSGGDIARQLPAEAKRFNNIDKSWVKIMSTANATPNCIQLTSVDDTLKSLLPYLTEQLELTQKSLSGYLEQKRNLFPRFYFVSDPVLLEILGQQSDPSSIQPHLLSIFDSVCHLDFDRVKKNLVLAMSDKSGERVPLSAAVEAKGSVEDWLNEMIRAMQRTLKDIVRQAVADTAQADFSVQEVFDAYPAQVTLLIIQVVWTAWAEQALRTARQDKKAMTGTLRRINGLLSTLVAITTQDLSKRQRTSIETLVTIHVHQRDVFEELVGAKVRSAGDFDWLKQTRFYWNVDLDTCKIQVTDIDFFYSYEYLGVNERLVVTPLTDRCYITLAQAIGMFLGGAPAGPAGTGKTETVKDMGKALGIYVVVFNCSDQMDYKGLGKIYRGLAQCGCFGDFDEFNRIDLDVLSVSAQQIQCIFTAIKERKKTFLYTDGCMVSLIPTAAIFITMNPGYAGRQELPENLKALFRTVAMICFPAARAL